MAQASFEPGTSRSRVLRSAFAPHWLGFASHSRFWLSLKNMLVNTGKMSQGWYLVIRSSFRYLTVPLRSRTMKKFLLDISAITSTPY